MEILILGASNKFKKIVKIIWPTSNITIIPWRSINKYKNINEIYQIILVCGYDYSSYLYDYERYLNNNVYNPLKLIKENSNKNTDVIYIMTDLPKRENTYSRYLYAKFLLYKKIYESKSFNSFIISIPTVLDDNGKMLSYKPGNKYIILFLLKFKIIKSISLTELQNLIANYINIPKIKECNLTAKYLNFKRTIAVDRILRLLIG